MGWFNHQVDYMLQQDLVEIILQAMSREFYQRKRPEEFFEWPGMFFRWSSKLIKIDLCYNTWDLNDPCFPWRRPSFKVVERIEVIFFARGFCHFLIHMFFVHKRVCIILSYRLPSWVDFVIYLFPLLPVPGPKKSPFLQVGEKQIAPKSDFWIVLSPMNLHHIMFYWCNQTWNQHFHTWKLIVGSISCSDGGGFEPFSIYSSIPREIRSNLTTALPFFHQMVWWTKTTNYTPVN